MAVVVFLGLWVFFVGSYLLARLATMKDSEYILFKE